jgi:acetyl esterase/lipase
MRQLCAFQFVPGKLLPVLVAVLVAGPAARAADAKPVKVERTKNISYCDIPNDPDRERHRLDVFRPVGKDDCPVVFFVHGGGWMIGSKEKVLGIYGYANIAEALARRGLVVVLPNYRLSPKAKHPDHIQDIARAFAWTREHAKEYGGRPDHIFACGHSAGGHLVSLLATDENYLKAEGLSAKDIKGVMSISGVYNVNAFDVKLGVKEGWFDFKTELHPFASVFGDDPEMQKQASPIAHVRPGLPPFLLIYGGLDYCPIRQTTKDFEAALEDKDCEVLTKKVSWCTHETVLVDLVHGVRPTTADALVRFVERHTRPADGAK